MMHSRFSLCILLVGPLMQCISAFSPQYTIKSLSPRHSSKAVGFTSSSRSMCICIDCELVTNCKAYHFVESKHEQPHINENPTFTPENGSPTIHVNIRSVRNNEDESERMWREHKAETAKAEEAAAANGDEAGDKPLVGEQTYDLSSATTIEYDVVKCASYKHDPGCWVRNMPQEIKDANPDFVPT